MCNKSAGILCFAAWGNSAFDAVVSETVIEEKLIEGLDHLLFQINQMELNERSQFRNKSKHLKEWLLYLQNCLSSHCC